jgi:hypothetical protein
MTSDYDIKMNLDETLELDTIIKKSDIASDPITRVEHISDSTDHKNDLVGFQTHTNVFNPPKSGKFEIDINGQTISIKVTDPSAIPNKEIDHFEDGNLSEYSAETGSFSVQSSVVKKETYALKGSMGGGDAVVIKSSSGLPHYPQRGDEFSFWIRYSGDQPGVGINFASTNGGDDRYSIDYRDSSSKWRLRSRINDSVTNLDSLSDDGTQREWHFVWVEKYLSDGTISVSIYDGDPTNDKNKIGTLSANNSDHNTGDIRIFVNDSSGGSTTGYFDHISYQ